MITFVNAKINIGLHITRRRPDGYHDLQTVFYPVGLHAATPVNPDPFCDILEITPAAKDELVLRGESVDCAAEDNLVWRALRLFRKETDGKPYANVRITLEKHLPFGAGMGGGSADASFALRMLNEISGASLSGDQLRGLALRLGADCPVFIANRPAYASGVGECLEELAPMLQGWWAVVVKPDLAISTREAFAGIVPRDGRIDLREAVSRPVSEWRRVVVNDFEESLFPRYPELARLKEELYTEGAVYASLTGSGAALYGLFASEYEARRASESVRAPYKAVLLL